MPDTIPQLVSCQCANRCSLGDRHGENILFEEGTGGILHVDFNCLFDKVRVPEPTNGQERMLKTQQGLTFDKPELVPFRLTHNMIDAFGAYGYNGPFRRTCEITLGLLRQNEDALMTILETFLYDPTTDFIGKKVLFLLSVSPSPPSPQNDFTGESIANAGHCRLRRSIQMSPTHLPGCWKLCETSSAGCFRVNLCRWQLMAMSMS